MIISIVGPVETGVNKRLVHVDIILHNEGTWYLRHHHHGFCVGWPLPPNNGYHGPVELAYRRHLAHDVTERRLHRKQ